ncbi:hypothetical protein Back2_12680 [Nocardioides baekrokdamisoli]|uniref:Bacterial Ig-like domain-containing protein n=1 Tax=Nocardioides baekrokdamisoli TaxID=1804624 RepID=A0A3G9ITM6_9ACTN|nr:Ig-like domain-containing protein [Nocardioides baekrokdamisoli]BBH16981.1 hypothetical protein Back2_12680 [Nocardioides baekrokdamisoli]
MFSNPLADRRRKAGLVAGTAAFALAAAVLGAASPAMAAPASPLQVFMEGASATFDPANAVTAGWWGHEGAGRTDSSFFSLDGKGSAASATPTSLAAQLAKIGPDAASDGSNVFVAYVTTSADGSAEKPTISAGETVGQAFGWFDGSTFDGALSGNSAANDYVDTVSTDASYTAWHNAGSPVVGYDASLTPIDAAAPGAPPSGAHALGKSILNNWPAGANISLVYYVSNATAANGEPIVQAGADGKAETAWMPFTTVAMPTDHSRDPINTAYPASYDTLRTSAGYVVSGAVAPTVKLKDSWSGTAGTLTATITDSTTGVTLTNATGSVQFMGRSVNATGGAFSDIGSPVTVTAAGTAAMPITGLVGGQFQEFEAVYTPDAAASSTYKSSPPSNVDQAFAPYATSTGVAVAGTLRVPYQQTVTATVAATGTTATGTVTFKDNGVTIATVALASGHASFAKAFGLGTHSIVAYYNGAAGIAPSSSGARAFTVAKAIPSITPVLSVAPSRLVHGMRPTLSVYVKAPGLVPTGTVTLVIAQPNGKVLTVRLALRSGKVAYVLPGLLHGTTKITIKYSGSTLVNAAAKAYAFAAR